jgi:hypothetical protein
MFLEERQKLLLKSHFPMIILLALDVLNGLVQHGHTDSKGTVFGLPAKEAVLRKSIMDPFGRTAFDELQSFGNRESGGQGKEEMDVVGPAANFDGLHLVLPGDTAQKGPESIAQLRRDERKTFLGAEDAMEIRADVRHGGIQPSLRDLGNNRFASPPNVETLGYSRVSLRDRGWAASRG